MHGRDAIFLDEIQFNHQKNEVKLIGEINGLLCTESDDDEFIGYELLFKKVYYFNMVELDVSLHMFDNPYNESSSFGEISNTKILRDIKNARDLELKQYVIYTYDDVFVIACQEFELRLKK
ncbi:integron gene cassette protein [Paenibacillus sp. DMB20]|nr:integron gene cassette protein [Paenibacillus sp. DMB20]